MGSPFSMGHDRRATDITRAWSRIPKGTGSSSPNESVWSITYLLPIAPAHLERDPLAEGDDRFTVQGVNSMSRTSEVTVFLLMFLVAACASRQPPTSMAQVP